MRILRGLSLLAVACVLGLTLMGLVTSPATAKPSPSVVVMDASAELALLGGGELEVLSLTCTGLCPATMPCLEGNCGIATPTCCCKWCNGLLDCRQKSSPGFCYSD